MYGILVTGIPASGKSTMAEYLSEALHIPVISKDKIKEILFDTVGFHSRTEKSQSWNRCYGNHVLFCRTDDEDGTAFYIGK